jgi:hypothetical protein
MNTPIRSLAIALGAFALVAQATALSEEPPTAQRIIERADEVRNPKDPFQMTVQLTEYIAGSARNEVTLTLYSKLAGTTGQFQNLVLYSAPPRDHGKCVLMNGTMMWFFDPASKSSIRISPEQRLVGQASQGDVVTVNFARDYSAAFSGPTGEETINDADKIPRKCWRIDLTPKDSEAIYAKAEYWVEEETFRPIKGKFFSDSGRLLKIAYYHRYERQLGADRPTETIIIDAVDAKLVTTMASGDYRTREIPDSWYQRDYLPRLRIE